MMTDEGFWNRIEKEVIPFVKKHHPKNLRYFKEKLNEAKNSNFKENHSLAYHQWMSLGCYLRNFYWEGLQVKILIDYCAIKCGESPEKIAL